VLVLAIVIAAFLVWRLAPRRAPHIVRVRGLQGEQTWIFNIRDLWVELRETNYASDALSRYELRRQGEAHWEMKLDPLRPAKRSLLSPTAGLPFAEPVWDTGVGEPPWVRCGAPVDEQLEAAHRSYNGVEDEVA
jgi:hypothetical protein